MSNLVLNVLKNWNISELLKLKEIPSVQKTRYGIKLENLTNLSDWLRYSYKNIKECFEEEAKSRENIKNQKFNYECTIFFKSFTKENYVKHLKDVRYVEKKPTSNLYGRSYLFSIKLDKYNKFNYDTLFIPYTTVMLFETDMAITELLKESKKNLENKILMFLKRFENKSINKAITEEINGFIFELFNKNEIAIKASNFFSHDYILEKIVFEDEKELDPNWIINAETKDLVEKRSEDKLINSFLTKNIDKIDIDDKRNIIEEIIKPENIPNSKWPYSINEKPSLMHSVILGIMNDKMLVSKEMDILSVNAPHGTDKPLLIKDMLANIVVERAKKLIEISPEDLFLTQEKIDDKNHFYKLNPLVAGYGSVIINPNNQTSENIAKELSNLMGINKSEFDENDLDNFEESGEKTHNQLLEELNLFPEISNLISNYDENKKSWGLFLAPFNKFKNISKTFEVLMTDTKKYNKTTEISQVQPSLFSELEKFKKEAEDKVGDVKSEFKEILNKIEQKKDKAKGFYKAYKFKDEKGFENIYTKKLSEKATELEKIKRDKEKISNLIEKLPKKNSLFKTLGISSSDEKDLKNKQSKIIKQEEKLEAVVLNLKKSEQIFQDKIEKSMEQIKEFEKILVNSRFKFEKSDIDFWKGTGDTSSSEYQYRQQCTPWLNSELESLRGELFIVAMKLHKYYNAINYEKLKNQINLIYKRETLDLNLPETKEALKEAWQSFYLLFPVINSDIELTSYLYNEVDEKIIDYLFLNEADQILSNQAIKIIYKSNHLISMGDTAQVRPVYSIIQEFKKDLKELYPIKDEFKYLLDIPSAQTLADSASSYGTYIKDSEWVGLPLWVNRGTIKPMFDISNKISYSDKMVYAERKDKDNYNSSNSANEKENVTEKVKINTIENTIEILKIKINESKNKKQEIIGKGKWIDSNNSVNNKPLKSNPELLFEALDEIWKKRENLDEIPNVFVITADIFAKSYLIKFLKDKLSQNYDLELVNKWLAKSVGRVQLFQNRKADIVFFVCNIENRDYLKNKANNFYDNPNYLNTALDKAKKEFYIIGDINISKESPYYKEAYSILKKFNK